MAPASSASPHSAEPARNGQTNGRSNGPILEWGGTPPDGEWLKDITRSMHRAAKRAHLIAYQTGTGVLYRREDGAVGIFKPDPAMYEDLIPPPFEDEVILRYDPVES